VSSQFGDPESGCIVIFIFQIRYTACRDIQRLKAQSPEIEEIEDVL